MQVRVARTCGGRAAGRRIASATEAVELAAASGAEPELRPRSRHPKALPRVSMSMSGCFSSVSQLYRKRDRLDPGGDCRFVAGEIAASQEIEPVRFSRRWSPSLA